MIVVGAGMSGLLAAHHFRSRPGGVTVLERQPGPADNHGALLRFRTDAVMRITGAPLKPVQVQKAIMEEDGSLTGTCTLLHANSYSYKVTGRAEPRSIISLEPGVRWVAAPDFLERMRQGVDVRYGSKVDPAEDVLVAEDFGGLINTAPLPDVLSALEIEHDPAEFRSQAITTVRAPLADVELYQTVYCPSVAHEPYRVSFAGGDMLIEYVGEGPQEPQQNLGYFCERILGFVPELRDRVSKKTQTHGKIVALPKARRRELIAQVTDRTGAYMLGRFGTWRQLLLDELVPDLKAIGEMLDGGGWAQRRLRSA